MLVSVVTLREPKMLRGSSCSGYGGYWVFTSLLWRLPFVMRTVLGTSVSGIGHDIEYKRQKDGTWSSQRGCK
jgi:hypothetical protein